MDLCGSLERKRDPPCSDCQSHQERKSTKEPLRDPQSEEEVHISSHLREGGKGFLDAKQPESAFVQQPDCLPQRGSCKIVKFIYTILLWQLLLQWKSWVIGLRVDPLGLTLSQEMCWNKISQVHFCITGWVSTRCWQAPSRSSLPYILNGSNGSNP